MNPTTTNLPPIPPRTFAMIRAVLLGRIQKLKTCWLWTGPLCGRNGRYGKIGWQGTTYSTHRMAAMVFKGFNGCASLQVNHTCDNTRCINPEHLYIGTQSDNLKDCVKRGRHPEANKTHCPHGHPYNKQNTLVFRGKRDCRECNRIKSRYYYYKYKEERKNGNNQVN